MDTADVGVAGVVRTAVRVVAIQDRPRDAASSDACIVHGANIIICAGSRIRDKYAADDLITGVVSADLPVVAVELVGTRFTAATLTAVTHGAGVAIVAGARGVGVVTAVHRIAPVEGADIRVVAIRLRSRAAGTKGTDVVVGTDVLVITGVGVEGIGTTRIGVAAVGGA